MVFSLSSLKATRVLAIVELVLRSEAVDCAVVAMLLLVPAGVVVERVVVPDGNVVFGIDVGVVAEAWYVLDPVVADAVAEVELLVWRSGLVEDVVVDSVFVGVGKSELAGGLVGIGVESVVSVRVRVLVGGRVTFVIEVGMLVDATVAGIGYDSQSSGARVLISTFTR